MARALETHSISFEEYLHGERDVNVRSEYSAGEIYAMAGASETHNTIVSDFSARINIQLPEECRVWQSDMKVVGKSLENLPFSYYPDIMAACGDNEDDPYYRTNPLLIVEVLSPSTKRIDLTEKLENYKQIASLLEYVVVSQDTPWIRVYRRRNNWQLETFGIDDSFVLESVELEISVMDIYRRVKREVGIL